MNLPNKLTVLRVLMIPFFVVFMITPLAEGNGKYVYQNNPLTKKDGY